MCTPKDVSCQWLGDGSWAWISSLADQGSIWQDLLRRDVLYYKGRLDMDDLEVVDVEDGKDRDLHVSVKNAFRLYCGTTGDSHLLCARKPEQKQRWLKAFAREREQVRLDQETGGRSSWALPSHWGPHTRLSGST